MTIKEILKKNDCLIPMNRMGIDIISKDGKKIIGHIMKKPKNLTDEVEIVKYEDYLKLLTHNGK